MSACIRDGCDATARARYLCSRHYSQARTTGNLPPRMSNFGKSPEERFLAFTEKTDSCWLWSGALTSEGYASFKADGQPNGHRWAYQHFVGAIPAGLYIDHLCRVRHCVNPDHLEAVTNAENIRRGESRLNSAKYAATLTHCPQGHEKTEANVYRSFNPKYNRWESACRPCRNARIRRRKESLRNAS